MKKTIIVMATIEIEGDHLNEGFIQKILNRINRWFRWSHRLEADNYIVAKVDFSDNFVEIDI